MPRVDLSLSELLYTAYHSPLGIVVNTDDIEHLRQKLYAIRRENPMLHCLSLVVSPINPGDLWIVKQGGSDAEGT